MVTEEKDTCNSYYRKMSYSTFCFFTEEMVLCSVYIT